MEAECRVVAWNLMRASTKHPSAIQWRETGDNHNAKILIVMQSALPEIAERALVPSS